MHLRKEEIAPRAMRDKSNCEYDVAFLLAAIHYIIQL